MRNFPPLRTSSARHIAAVIRVAFTLMLPAFLDAGARCHAQAAGAVSTNDVISAATNAPSSATAVTNSADSAKTVALSSNEIATINAVLANTNAPEPGHMPTPGVLAAPASTSKLEKPDPNQQYKFTLEIARKQRESKALDSARKTLVSLLETNAPAAFQRQGLFELALVEQDSGNSTNLAKALQIFGQFLSRYPDDELAAEVLLRQGLIYRQMGVPGMAINKFFSTMSSALKLDTTNAAVDYPGTTLQAQIEIADTYYLEGKYEEAADYFTLLLKANNARLKKEQIQYKLIRSVSYLTNDADTVARAQVFLDNYHDSTAVPEVRFILASALKKLGRNADSSKQVLLLLQSQEDNAKADPATWAYWQQRAGNEIANQLFKDGDYFDALAIYNNLAELDKSPSWQLPVWYQIGLVYEQLKQPKKASDMYSRLLDRQKELAGSDLTPSLSSLLDMAKWRKDYTLWLDAAISTNQVIQASMPKPASRPGATPE